RIAESVLKSSCFISHDLPPPMHPNKTLRDCFA
ncbi:unnamed protein product, partial [Heterotrigona itama]